MARLWAPRAGLIATLAVAAVVTSTAALGSRVSSAHWAVAAGATAACESSVRPGTPEAHSLSGLVHAVAQAAQLAIKDANSGQEQGQDPSPIAWTRAGTDPYRFSAHLAAASRARDRAARVLARDQRRTIRAYRAQLADDSPLAAV